MLFTPHSIRGDENSQSLQYKQVNSSDFKPYYFIAFGDTRSDKQGGIDDNSGLEALAPLIDDLVEEYNVTFMLHVGDVVENGGDQDWWDSFWWPLMGDGAEDVQIYYAVGNHEYQSESGIFDLDLITFKANVENPGNEIYFSFNSPQNDTHFVFFNSEYRVSPFPNFQFATNNATLWDEQEAWLIQDLSENTIERVIAVFHRPIFGVNPTKFDDYLVMEELLQEILITGGVDQVFVGHDHYFYHTVRDGIHNTVTAGGCVNMIMYDPFAHLGLESDYGFSEFELCLVKATQEGFEVDVIHPNGSILYEYNIEEPIPDTSPPTVSSAADIVIIEGTLGYSITWSASDANPGQYTISQDGVEVDSGSWVTGTPISYSLDGLEIGDYVFNLLVQDLSGNSVSDTVLVSVKAYISEIPTSSTTTTTEQTTVFSLILLGLIPLMYYRKKRTG